MNVAFIGLGVMGFNMAGHLAKAGHHLRIFNRTPDKADRWSQQFGGLSCSSPADACERAEVAFLCVGDDPDVESVVLGENGVLEQMEEGTVVVDHTTTSAHLANRLFAACAAKNVHFIDAPVSGGEIGAANGTLTVMCGGDELAYGRTEPLIAAYARYIKLLGPSGSGQLAKMVNQICIAGIVQGLSEALDFGQKAGLDMESVIDVISKGASQSWQMDNRATTMLQQKYDFGFAVDWMRKDLRICKEQAALTGVSLPITTMIDQFYAEVQDSGGGRWDTSSLFYRQTRSAKS